MSYEQMTARSRREPHHRYHAMGGSTAASPRGVYMSQALRVALARNHYDYHTRSKRDPPLLSSSSALSLPAWSMCMQGRAITVGLVTHRRRPTRTPSTRVRVSSVTGDTITAPRYATRELQLWYPARATGPRRVRGPTTYDTRRCCPSAPVLT